MDLKIERLNELVLNLTTNDGEYEMKLLVDQCSKGEPTMKCVKQEREQIVTVRVPLKGMMLYKKLK